MNGLAKMCGGADEVGAKQWRPARVGALDDRQFNGNKLSLGSLPIDNYNMCHTTIARPKARVDARNVGTCPHALSVVALQLTKVAAARMAAP
jgi:hypothetical protein